MKLNPSKFILFLLLVVFSFSLLPFVSVDAKELETSYPGIGEQPGLSDDATLPEYVKYIFQISFIIIALASFAVFIYGGFVFLTSGGSPTSRNEGKNWLLSGILGLIIALCSYLILNAINPDLLKIRFGDLVEPDPTTTPSTNPSVEDKNFQEIPIGTLVEILLAKNIDCYNYDLETGDMIAPAAGCPCAGGGGSGGEDGGGVDMMKDHDRLDCIKKLAEAVETKDKKLKEFSEELKSEVDKCNCSRCSCGGSCSGDPCPNRGKIDDLREEIKKIITGEGVTDPNFLDIREGVKRLKEMRAELQEDRNNLIAAETLMKQDCKYGTPFNLVKFFDAKQEKDYLQKIEFKDFDIREYCIEFNCIDWKFEDDLKKKFCIEYELNDKGRLCGATTTQAIVEATGKKDIKEYFVFDGDPASFYCSLKE